MSDDANQKTKKSNAIVLATILGVLFLGCVCGGYDAGLFGGASTTVPTLSSADGKALADKLAEAYDVQGICYGWRLQTGGSSTYSYSSSGRDADVGSNFGDGRELVASRLPEECDKAVVLRASVTYTSSTSESGDDALVTVVDHGIDLPYSVNSDLARFGVTKDALIDDPVGAVVRGTLALPLLVAEYGLATPLPRPSDSATAAPAGGAVGSDLLRDRGWLLITAVGLVLLSVLAVVLGFRSRRRAREAAATVAVEAAREAVARRRKAEKEPPAPSG